MKYYLLLILFSLSICFSAMSENGHHHSHELNEIGLSIGGTYSTEHKEWGSGFHIHYFRALGLHSHWAIGISAEQVWADGSHYNLSAGLKYRFFDKLELGIMPGVTFLNNNEHVGNSIQDVNQNKYKAQFAIHTEIVYDMFHFGEFHLGPAIDYSWTEHDPNFMIGVHMAYCF